MVNKEHYKGSSEQHPFVWCFFLNITPSLKTTKKIMDYFDRYDYNFIYRDIYIILGRVLHKHGKQIAREIVSNFSQCISKTDLNVALECVLWDKPEALHKHKTIDLSRRYSWYSLISIAQFLGHDDCARVLEEYRQSEDAKPNNPETETEISFFRVLAEQERKEYSPVANASPYTCLVHIYKRVSHLSYSVGCESLCQFVFKTF